MRRRDLDSEKVLNAIEVQQGILVERMEDQYSFSHLTLQEYLAAQYLVDNNEWKGLVQGHITDNRWREIFLLLPGLMSGRSGADSLLLAMKKQADGYINTPRLKALMQWAETAIDKSEEKSKPAAKRSVAIFLILALNRRPHSCPCTCSTYSPRHARTSPSTALISTLDLIPRPRPRPRPRRRPRLQPRFHPCRDLALDLALDLAHSLSAGRYISQM